MVAALVFPHATAALVREFLPPGARVIAVDAGAEALRAAGVRPDLVVGDMDSISGATLAAFEAEGIRIERHPTSKRDSDGALAIAHAKEEDEVLFLGPGGGRADHALANLHLLVRASASARARAIDADAFTWVATPERPLRLERPAGTTLSVLPFGGPAEGVTYSGLRYALKDAPMATGDPYGISNECLSPPQEIRLRKGILLVIEPRGV